jgi:cardiolipin synthase
MAGDSGNLVIVSAAVTLAHTLGVMSAAHAVMTVRSSQGAIAWGMSLVTFPWLALPLYWSLGRNKFHGYTEVLRSALAKHQDLIRNSYSEVIEYKLSPEKLTALQHLAETLRAIPFTSGNAAELLIDGQQTYAAMLAAIASAKDYILLQSYIVNDDEVGDRFKQALIACAARGIRICVLYDEIGSNKLSRPYLNSLRHHAVQVSAFHTTKGRGNRFQINFRNHRKILVVDGDIAFVGGLNIGDEYLGKDRRLSPWRDTHMKLEGPAAKCLQISFLQDWYWATREVPDVCWQVTAHPEINEKVFVFATGPADSLPACNLFFVSAIHQAQARLWIASPYFVPDESTLIALKLAALRGVDVRIILPNHPDHRLVYLCSFSYYNDLLSAGIKLHRYQEGFMHQKVILIDRELAGVGTVNLDNRSFFLNFEVMGFVSDLHFVEKVEKMLLNDFKISQQVDLSEYNQKPFWFKLAVRGARLLSPLL